MAGYKKVGPRRWKKAVIYKGWLLIKVKYKTVDNLWKHDITGSKPGEPLQTFTSFEHARQWINEQ